ncbi:DsbA family protein [Numidum massiliense]|uniref:DsbA family protein n=1 Tax=Numidum massiliense TaxID=1522315 RepID=UPI0006D54D17|nr:thioredoxin domain-containing protein [Numidum massiliense]
MAKRKQTDRKLELIFGGVVLVVLLAIVIPLLVQSQSGSTGTDKPPQAEGTGSDDAAQSEGDVSDQLPQPARTGLDVPLDADDQTLGEEKAPVTVFEFSDYQCPACQMSVQMLHPTLKKLIDDGDVRYVFKDYPLNMHPNAPQAAVAARAAGEQGEYWAMHDLLFAQQQEWAKLADDDFRKKLLDYAQELGLDEATFEKALKSKTLKTQVDNGRQLANDLNIEFTPTFVIGGAVYEEGLSVEQLRAIVQDEKSKKSKP